MSAKMNDDKEKYGNPVVGETTEKFIDSKAARMIIACVIVLNTIVIFINGYYPNSRLLELVDALFTLIFLAEAIMKIHDKDGWKAGWRKYWKNNWNKFDFIILVIALPSISQLFFEGSLHTNELLTLRCLRILKALRMFPNMPDFDRLFTNLKSAFKTTFFILLSFLIFLIIFAVLSSTLFGDVAPEYFRDPGVSLYSIFRLFTVEGWYELPDVIARNSTPAFGLFAKFYFSILLFAGGIIGLSLINSIFVDAMTADNNNPVKEKLDDIEKQIQQLAAQLDNDTTPHDDMPSEPTEKA